MERSTDLKAQRLAAMQATQGGPPRRTSNPFFGVGPITDATSDEVDSRLLRFQFEHWLEQNYRKLDDKGNDLGPFTVAEISRSMHRGYPADKILLDMMREIHRYFEFPKSNRMAVGLGGGHSGFTVCLMHLMSAHDAAQNIYVDTPKPESESGKAGGFFRQSWGAQIVELQRFAKGGDENRIHFAEREGQIPDAVTMERMGIKLFIGVGHETTGATTYTRAEVDNLLEWLERNPQEHHAVLDATSMLGAMPWGEDVVRRVMAECCLFMPFQKAIGGISGYFAASFTPQALVQIEANQKNPSWAIPRQLKLAAPLDAKLPLSGERSVQVGPFYDPAQNKMVGGVINTYSTLAFAETTFGLLRSERRLGSVSDLNRRSIANRAAINEWVAAHPLLALGVEDAEHRGAAVTLLKVVDPQVTDLALYARIIARSKQLLGYEGLTHPNGEREPGLDVARYVNAFPGTAGDYRAWIGGIRAPEDVTALLDNLRYAYLRAKIVVLEEELAQAGVTFAAAKPVSADTRRDDAKRAYKILVCDPVGLKLDGNGQQDASAVRAHIEGKGGVFHAGPYDAGATLAPGRIHFFYQPDLSTEAEILPLTCDGHYDGVIAAATLIPKGARFAVGGVRIGAGTGNMASESWGGGSGEGGTAVLMNTPSFNSRATAHMVMKALLRVAPELPFEALHQRVVARDFDTGRDLKSYPVQKLEGKKLAIFGFGNIGREVAKLAQTFGMHVVIHARPRHQAWIESEGFAFAADKVEAARGADFISPHTGLGTFNAATGKYVNADVINADVLNVLNRGAVLVNFDRGEVVNAAELEAALSSGQVRFACVDADIFVDAKSGAASGPLVPYLAVEARHPDKLLLLPHVAADTDHDSRVAGAKQAVNQMFDLIQFGRVSNLKGSLPDGLTSAGSVTVAGVGQVSSGALAAAVADDAFITAARQAAETSAALWGALASTTDPARRKALLERYGADVVKTGNAYATLLDQRGLRGPFLAE